MNKQLPSPRKYIYISVCVIIIGTLELLLIRGKLSVFYFYQWAELDRPPSKAEYVVEYGYVQCKDGKTYRKYSIVDDAKNWKHIWLEADDIDEYYAYDSNISTCHIPDMMNVKSLVIRCRKLENYSKTYAMAISNDGRIYEYVGPSLEENVSFVYLVVILLLLSINFGLLFVLVGFFGERLAEKIGERRNRKKWYIR